MKSIELIPLQVSRLTRREYEVLVELAKGKSNKGIAAALTISEATVEAHLFRSYRKLGVSSRAEAIVRALQLHLIEV